MAPSPLAIRPRQHHRRSTRSRRPPSGLPGRTGEPLAMDDATSPRIRRAHPARGNNRPRQQVGHQGRAHTDRGRMVRERSDPLTAAPQDSRQNGLVVEPTAGLCAGVVVSRLPPRQLPTRRRHLPAVRGPPRGLTTTTPPTPRSSTRPADESSTSVRTWQPRHVRYAAMRASPPSAPTTGSPSSPQRRNWLCTTWQQKARPWRSAHCRPSATATRPAP